MNIQDNIAFKDFVKEIKNRILSSQYEALKKVNRELIDLYWNMRQFYLEYYQDEKLQPLVGEISWTKNVVIFEKIKDVLAKEFGIIICKDKKRTTVEYALKESNQPIGIATYKLSKELPNSLKNYLPTTSEIENSLMEYLKRLDAK